jgi:cytochrome b561
MLFWIASMHPITFLMDLVGVAIGLPLLYFAAKHSVFEWRGDDVFYKTHIWIEILVLILFFFRFFYRFFYQGNAFQTAHTPEEVQQQLKILYDPFMSIVIFLVCTYYVGYAIFLLKKVSGLRMGHEARRFN